MGKKKYMLHPGRVISKADGQEHYIQADQLARLYGVPLRECEIVAQSDALYQAHAERKDVIHLYPRFNGDYTLPANAALCGPREAASQGNGD